MSVVLIFMIKTDLGNALGIGAPFLLFLTAIMLSTWFGGLLAGILCIFFSTLISLFFYLPPYNSFAISNINILLQLFVFIFEGFTISFITNSYMRRKEDAVLMKKNKYPTIMDNFHKLISQKSNRYIFGLFFISYFIFVLNLFARQIGDLSFVDAFNNYVGGYFMLKGKMLYSQVFFNHQMLMPYISYLIQLIFHPTSLTRIVSYHRLFVLLFSTIADLLLIWRFKYNGLGFVLFYELSDFYLFGNFFLGEALLVYPLIYLFGLVWEKIYKQNYFKLELLLGAFAVWLIIFLRETFLPIALFFYILLLWNKKFTKFHIISLAIFIALTSITLLTIPLKEYYFQLVTTNVINNIPNEVSRNNLLGFGILSVLFYPLVLLSPENWNFFHIDLIGLDSTFLILFLILTIKLKQVKGPLILFIALALAAIRFVSPGTIFYGAFHLLPWYGLLIFSVFLMLSEVYKVNHLRKTVNILLLMLICIFGFLVVTFHWYAISHETFQQKFDRNYGRYYSHGKAINILALKKSTLFIDGWDSLIYWVADIPSSYTYSLYYPVMTHIPTFDNPRLAMFHNNPPDFYYTDCEHTQIELPFFAQKYYVRLLHNNTPGCLFVAKKVLLTITPEKIEKLKKLGFRIPKSNQ
ncbi:MAG TPA: DUF4118 domain-containing protein [Candidatus Sulfotelmatobacter sp.]|nr:DUF4118 domain-containing protein [Candidatus Sulfotelmatobacter sp.]